MHWTIEVDDDVAKNVAAVAAERGVAPEEVAGEVVAQRYATRRRKLSFIGMGHSGHSDTAERHEEIIREAFSDKTAREA